ncbi:aspartate 1-decarboxylase [Campylobacter lari]|uniref:Aspartate 1-decarboxylase n=1 Tax=Campylobacter lari TaxID=201 RepID=A0A698FWP5_CAMLA|nr:aspartate 1-decarboxylase [Campylobacter lari]ECW8955392.1 aspartate 1-decarboxylase [Campylobacter lari]MBT0794912.1 aspartate 1-decarboxylase [Campylobacter lari]MBT0826912.1 aspartate 1-decarboxylase [Campylobacter lari]MBT0832216.1 aspartate 1-decarboxylase [Campylobacter lari]
MNFEMLYAKLHRATVTDANLNYVGSITIDEELLNLAHLREFQKVDIVNINNGERFTTYIIKGKKGSREFCLNGAAARKVQIGDKIIVIAYANFNAGEADTFSPYIIQLDDSNNVIN